MSDAQPEPVPPAPADVRRPKPGNHSSRRINHLLDALGGTRYLEIGVAKGNTFRQVKAAEKVAVDPRFRFDFRAEIAPGVTFCEVPSDVFFARHAAGRVFDVMFIDGLHTFVQTLRDVCASMRHAHAGTVWLIDDTVPSDAFSALTDANDARRFRSQHGLQSNAWHGDIYKVVFAVADLFPNLSYCTINTDGNPQTLFWGEPRADFAPRFPSVEAIERTDWFALQGLLDAMRLVDEDEGLALAVSGVAAARAAPAAGGPVVVAPDDAAAATAERRARRAARQAARSGGG